MNKPLVTKFKGDYISLLVNYNKEDGIKTRREPPLVYDFSKIGVDSLTAKVPDKSKIRNNPDHSWRKRNEGLK